MIKRFFVLGLMIYFIAVGRGIYFATKAVISLGYTAPDAQGRRHMFMGKNLTFDLFVHDVE